MRRMGAPGTGLSRREFLKATGVAGLSASAGCTAPSAEQPAANTQTTTAAASSSLPTTAPPQVVDVEDQGGSVTLKTKPARHEVHPLDSMGGPVELPKVWAFQADDRPPSVPAPILRTTEGEDMEVVLDNTQGKRPHTVHFHGVQKAWKDDGVPTTTGITVKPGEKHTYTIPANVPGTHIYHCHFQTHRHIDMGMYGIFRVDPKGYEPADKEYFMTLKEWDSRLNRMMAGEDVSYSPRNRNPDVFTINGKSAPRTLHPEDGSPIIVSQGDTVRLHLVNGGYMSHPMHIHNHRFQRVEKDGGTVPKAARHDMDVTNIAPAERHTIEFTANSDPGIYLMHCHKVNHVMNGNFYPGGMLSGVVYEEAMDTDIFATLMDYAGYKG
ncbi:multicopper oxidase domain-containing protein [Halogeometricum borinquense]|uniref:Multicopper oxidase domain-containing protein n=2 Tax=Halogeometricum borinquense TaxID=60847 RepID=A0A482T8R9_9EURY|nr:multicopper oxidase domain-containing protein [Halogeometricum borinquense]QIB74907.1 multicopper oxidase domain-containing protein [Halogeometricum borinquense]RYJ14254.1 twin-arginine translocation signal domain-containing protein [Halogeometricum borinquense]